ncbi:MAG: hydrogenase nickel incorporation protein HypB [Planctomycetota bacterium]
MRIEVLKRLQEQSDAQAEDVRRLLGRHRVALFNIMGSPGCGKTTLLEATLSALQTRHSALRCAVLEGDIATLQDAERIAALGVPVAQLLTEGGCHLKPGLVHSALRRFDLDALDCVFVENVGNLVCPANFDLGEHRRVVVLSVAEGDDKITKYPYAFQRADAIVISKLDLLALCRFDLVRARSDVRTLNPSAEVLEVSAFVGRDKARAATRAGAAAGETPGFEAWLCWVGETVERVRAADFSPHRP